MNTPYCLRSCSQELVEAPQLAANTSRQATGAAR